ncbi:MAG: hypothetical protein ACYDB1_00835 [Acidiferrobacteraceae bacterium]
MAEEQVELDEALVSEARGMGWVPEEEWKGDKEKWVPADEFVRRGQEIMPILRQNNKALKEELGQLRRENATVADQLRAVNTSLRALQETQANESEANEAARQSELLEDLKDAIREDDADRQAEILRQLTARPKETKAPTAEVNSTPTVDAETQSFISDNSWYGQDMRRTSLMNGIAAEMRMAGSPLKGRAFLDAVKEEVDKVLDGNGSSQRREGKVESSRGGAPAGDRSGGRGVTGRYADLPSDARAQCDKDLPANFPTRRYKDAAAYRKAWAELYFSQG